MRVQRIRFEHFGGIIAIDEPATLLWVDRDYLRARGFDGDAVWAGIDPGYLSGPVEVEIAITTRCNLRCPCCYTSAERGGRDVPLKAVTGSLDAAARAGAFHVALGGGEPLIHPDLLRIGRAARERGLLPSLTTNGYYVTPRWAKQAKGLFSRVNVSIDLLGGPRDSAMPLAESLKAVRTLVDGGITCGCNLILTEESTPQLTRAFSEASKAGADSLMLLRGKPSGRGKDEYDKMRLCAETQTALIPRLLRLSESYNLPFHLDCALAPLVLTSAVSRQRLEAYGAYGCIAGDLLATVDPEGLVHPCSHLDFTVGRVEDLPALWHERSAWAGFRNRSSGLSGKCTRCGVRDLCRGGCAVVNSYYGIGLDQPDPGLACSPRSFEAGAPQVPLFTPG